MGSIDEFAIDPSSMPDTSAAEADFHETSFFQTPRGGSSTPQLPTPAAVRGKRPGRGYDIVTFEHLGLVVKFGDPSQVRLEGAVAMQAVRRAFPNNDVPVPELFGWRVSEGYNFIYMSLVPGSTLRECWPSLTQGDKESICRQLGQIVAALRRLTPDAFNLFVGSVNRGHVQDNYFRGGHEAGPFHSIKAFNDWVQFAAIPGHPTSERSFHDPYRELLPDTGHINFSHADLNLGNVMISGPPGSRTVSGIVDWDQAGWYPEYWEYCKMHLGVEYWHEWRSAGWVEKVTQCYEDEFTALAEYMMWRGP